MYNRHTHVMPYFPAGSFFRGPVCENVRFRLYQRQCRRRGTTPYCQKGDPMTPKQKILIADDSEMNRAILSEMLGEEYEIIEVEDGAAAVAALQKYGAELSLLLLDIVMPKMDGFQVLEIMRERRWIDDVPVVMISSESASSHVERAYDLGATDFISRPFDARVVHRRVVNTILLYSKQKKLIDLVMEQIYEKEKQSSLMVDILSHIVEFRNGESGLHVLHIRTLTELLLKHLVQMTDRYPLTPADITLISTASALHDIGKISIPGEILNKPGRLTEEEFAIMKTHSAVGAAILEELPFHQNEPLVQTAYEICRWHHERYDGRGYPDGLKGDEIPLSAQIVAMADVYDALTSERVYKKAIPHEEAIQMIIGGQCGTFNPLLLQCLQEVSDQVRKPEDGHNGLSQYEVRKATEELLRREELTASDRTLQLLEHERMKYSFFAAMSGEIQFEFTLSPPMITLSSWGAGHLGMPETIMNPLQDQALLSILGEETIRGLVANIQATTPDQPIIQYDCEAHLSGELRWVRFICRATWSPDEPPQCTGAIGKAVDIHEERKKLNHLEREAAHDALTGLLNHKYAKMQIKDMLKVRTDCHFALAVLDLDRFKSVNDTYGHMFGDEVLVYSSGRLKHSVRGNDIVARIGGDEFLIFIEYQQNLEVIVDRIFSALICTYKNFPISVSMGVARTEAVGRDYNALFKAADQALYTAKRTGSGKYCFYIDTMQPGETMVSQIENMKDPVKDTEEKEEETT